jgi:hypothetical protein
MSATCDAALFVAHSAIFIDECEERDPLSINVGHGLQPSSLRASSRPVRVQ